MDGNPIAEPTLRKSAQNLRDAASDLWATRQAFYERLGYVPGPDQRYVRPVDDLSLDYYHRLLRRS